MPDAKEIKIVGKIELSEKDKIRFKKKKTKEQIYKEKLLKLLNKYKK
jgi:hypothetical protein